MIEQILHFVAGVALTLWSFQILKIDTKEISFLRLIGGMLVLYVSLNLSSGAITSIIVTP